MKLCEMIEIYLKYTIRTINAFIWINNHVNSSIKCMLSEIIKNSFSNILTILAKNFIVSHSLS